MESDADRLASIKALGGLPVRVRGEEFWAIFDNEFVEQGGVEGSAPSLSFCRMSDLERLAIVKDDVLDIAGASWRVRLIEPDRTGGAVVRLRK